MQELKQDSRGDMVQELTIPQLRNALLNTLSNVVCHGYTHEMHKEFDNVQVPKQHWENLTFAQCLEYGFKHWEEGSNLMLMPGYYYKFLPHDLVLTAIDGETCAAQDIDNDTRFGCLAFGLVVKD